ncbi:hypothetical protein [Alteromonas sp. KUL49]|uniref:hypothetical protein n=1 Tax=Alteromonas sp. KUL49 TaxID=2480798 RepID=UPI00102F1008|nr:hypothetical protein [Alteromonas sp. KUL49]TAP39394.1 hypothetical protein EYS00_12735 [Alteromonas sp. KUL49]GEA12189.1 hypothetical protein KUL49_25640 [Alteromonas sp. KUL49]
MSNIHTLIANTLDASPEARGPLIYKLQRFVKQHEGDKVLAPLESELHKFCEFIIDERDNVNGCAISMFRRIPINQRAVEQLITVSERTLNSDLIEIFGYIDNKYWRQNIENYVTKGLSNVHCRYAASRTLDIKASCLQSEKTVEAIAETLSIANPLEFGSLCSALRYAVEKSSIANAKHHFNVLLKSCTDERREQIESYLAKLRKTY